MAMGKRDLGLERSWRRMLSAWRRGGLTVRAFCQAKGLAESAFYYWRRELQRRQEEVQGLEARPVFVPVRIRADADAVAAAGDGGIEIVLAGRRVLRVRRGFDRALLSEVLAALEGGA